MTVASRFAIGDPVELIDPVDNAPAGSKGGVTDVLDDGKVVVELTSMPAEPILDRIVVVTADKLRSR